MPAKGTSTNPSTRARSTAEKPRLSPAELQLLSSDQEARVPEEDRPVTPEDKRPRVKFKDELFLIDAEQGLMPLMEWSVANDSENPELAPQLAAMYYLLEDLVLPEDWDRFRKHARKTRAKIDDYLAFQRAAAEVITAVPTEEPAGS
jgi:hypothetical protein